MSRCRKLSSFVLSPVVTVLLVAAVPGQQQSEPPVLASIHGLHELSDGSFRADGSTFAGAFDRHGATLQVVDPRRQQLVGLSLRLKDWGRAGTVGQRAHADVAPQRAGADSVRYQRDGIVERYRVTATGFEQSFVLPSRPSGHGDLVLGIAVSSDSLHSVAKPAAQQALEFVGHDVPSVGYGEAVAFSRADASDRVAVATRYDGAGRIELIVPGALLDRASYPLIVDPVVGPVNSPGGSGATDVHPDVAYDPLEDVFIVVWERRLSLNNRQIRAQRYRRGGEPLGGVIAIPSVFGQTPTVGFLRQSNGGFLGFYVVWSDSAGLRGQRIETVSGNLVGSQHALTNVPSGTRDLRPALSMRGNELIVAWDRTPSGASSPNEIRVRRVVLSNVPLTSVGLGNEFVVDSTTAGFVRRPRMPRAHFFAGGAQTRLVWERFFNNPAPGDYDVRTASLAISDLSIAYIQSPAGVPGASAIGVDERSPDVAQINNVTLPNTLVAWEDPAGIRAQRYVMSGTVGSTFDIRTTSDRETAPAVGAGSTEFTVGYFSAPFNNAIAQDVYAARVSADGTLLAAHRPVETLGGPLQVGLRASSVPETFAAANRPNGVMFGWVLESRAGGVINDVKVAQFDPVVGIASPFGTGCMGPGNTLPAMDVNSDPYPGNLDFELQLGSAPPNSLCVLLIGDQFTTTPVPGAPGCNLYTGPPILVVPSFTSTVGTASVALPIPASIAANIGLATQFAIYTPGWNALEWIASDDIDLNWFQ